LIRAISCDVENIGDANGCQATARNRPEFKVWLE
jgi:hypothetical protein